MGLILTTPFWGDELFEIESDINILPKKDIPRSVLFLL